MGDERKRNPRPSGGGRPSGARGGQRGPVGQRGGSRRPRPEPEARTEDQQIYDGPPIPDDISAKDLDRQVRDQLRSLPGEAGRPDRQAPGDGRPADRRGSRTGLQACVAARARSQRSAVIREAVGRTA